VAGAQIKSIHGRLCTSGASVSGLLILAYFLGATMEAGNNVFFDGLHGQWLIGVVIVVWEWKKK
jgi:hypothetical protein